MECLVLSHPTTFQLHRPWIASIDPSFNRTPRFHPPLSTITSGLGWPLQVSQQWDRHSFSRNAIRDCRLATQLNYELPWAWLSSAQRVAALVRSNANSGQSRPSTMGC